MEEMNQEGAARGVRLPALASPYAFGAAHAACAGAAEGGDALPAAARALAAAAAREALGAYRARLEASRSEERDDGVHRVGEKGALQVLFDVRFLYERVRGGSDAASEDDAEARFHADAARANAAALRGVVAAASAALDPIDWATYEAPLWRNVARARARSARPVLGLASASEGVSGASAVRSPRRRKPSPRPRRAAPRRRRRRGFPTCRSARRARGEWESRWRSGARAETRGWGRRRAGPARCSWTGPPRVRRVRGDGAPGRAFARRNAGGNFFGKLAGQGLGFIRAL